MKDGLKSQMKNLMKNTINGTYILVVENQNLKQKYFEYIYKYFIEFLYIFNYIIKQKIK